MKSKIKNSSIIVAILMMGAFVGSLSSTLIAPALPTIMKDFNITASSGQWLTTIYLLVIGIMIPTTAYLINRFKTRTLFISCLMFFISGSILSLVSRNFEMLIISRAMQAAGAGVLMPLLQVTVLNLYPPEKRGAAMGLVGITVGFAPAVGPTLSGWLINSFGWHSIFVVTLVLGLINIIMGIFLLRNVGETIKCRLDKISVILSSLGFGGLLLGFTNQGTYGFINGNTLIPLFIGVVSLLVFSYRQISLKEPLLDLSVFKNKQFSISTILICIVYGSMMSATMIIPMYVQNVRGYSALSSGLILFPGALLMVILNPFAGKIYDKYGARLLCIVGMACLCSGNIGFVFLNESISIIYLSAMYGLRMIGITLLLMPLTVWGLALLPQRKISDGTAINNTLRQVAGAIGSAILVAVMVNVSSSSVEATKQLNDIHGIVISFAVASLLGIIGLVLSIIFIKDNEDIDDISSGIFQTE